MSVPSIPEFFADKTIFITGSTGFLGKVIVEKLLRSCPEIKKIYLIIRSQKGVSPENRMKEFTSLPLFDTLREVNQDSFKKLFALSGDVSEVRLGLSTEDYEKLVKEVNIIFHVAASVRFDDSLPKAIKMNTRGTREVLEMGVQMKNLKSVIHVSTTYCNCDRQEVDEIVYPPPLDWKTTIKIIEDVDTAAVNVLTRKILGPLPNTYTFSKALSESLVNSYKDRLPVVIFRPSIVISSWKDPIPGWLDNINGPVSIMLGAGRGVIRTLLVDPDIVPDYMPVDIASKAIIAAAWKRAVFKPTNNNIAVYNCSSMSKSISMRQLLVIGLNDFWKNPEAGILWIPSAHFCQSETWFYINCLFKHLLPAILVDSLLHLTGRKPILVKLQRKIYTAMISLSYFTLREWKFSNNNFLDLNKQILPVDKKDFDYDFADIVPTTFFQNARDGGRKYILKETDINWEEARIKAYRMYWVDLTVKIVSAGLLFWFLCKVIMYNFGWNNYF